jgi:capsular exopolysaccharide synthesis family protein
MHDANQSVSLPNIFALLRRHLLLITLTVMLAVGASLGLSAATNPTYSASSQVGFNDDSADLQALGIPASPSFQPDKEAAAQAERITRPDVIDEVRKDLRIKLTTDEIQSAITTQVEVASNLVSINAEAETGELAASLANRFAAAIRDDSASRSKARYRAVAKTSQKRAAKLKGDKNAGRRAVYEDQAARLLALAAFAKPVDIVRSATVPSAPSSPKPVRNAVLAGLLGAMLGIGLAFLRQAFDRRLREQRDVEDHIDAPVLGFLRTAALGKTPLPAGGKKRLTKDEDIEPFRILRTNIAFLAGDRSVKTVLVTSPLPEEGKSTVAAGLAWAEAMTGRRTLLVDCDLRRPTVASRLGIDTVPGLADFLVGDAEPGDILRTVDIGTSRGDAPQLVCIPAGSPVPNHAELLESDRFRGFLEQVSQVYDRVILDSAPLLPVSDTLALLPQIDGILLCLRLGQTTRDEALAARATFDHFPTKPVGLVLTAADTGTSPYYVGSYAYSRPAAEQVT